MTPTLQAALARYSDRVAAEMRQENLTDLGYAPFVLDDDLAGLVPDQDPRDPSVYGFVVGYVSAQVARALQ